MQISAFQLVYSGGCRYVVYCKAGISQVALVQSDLVIKDIVDIEFSYVSIHMQPHCIHIKASPGGAARRSVERGTYILKFQPDSVLPGNQKNVGAVRVARDFDLDGKFKLV